MPSFWGPKSKSGIKPTPPKIRVERIPVAKKPSPLPSRLASRPQQVRRPQDPPACASSSSSRTSPATPPSDRRDSDRLQPRKRKAARQKSPTQQKLEPDSGDEESSTSYEDPRKKQKVTGPVDLKRQLRSQEAFSVADGGVFEMIHAADLASTGRKSKVVTTVSVEDNNVELKYPSASQCERFVRRLYSS